MSRYFERGEPSQRQLEGRSRGSFQKSNSLSPTGKGIKVNSFSKASFKESNQKLKMPALKHLTAVHIVDP